MTAEQEKDHLTKKELIKVKSLDLFGVTSKSMSFLKSYEYSQFLEKRRTRIPTATAAEKMDESYMEKEKQKNQEALDLALMDYLNKRPREIIPILPFLSKLAYYGLIFLGAIRGMSAGSPIARKFIDTDPIAACMTIDRSNPLVTAVETVAAIEVGVPGLAATFGAGRGIRINTSNLVNVENAPQRPVHVAALERQTTDCHFLSESESTSSQGEAVNYETSVDTSGGSSHSQSESQEEVSAQSESQEEVSPQSSEEKSAKQSKNQQKLRGAKKGVQSRSNSLSLSEDMANMAWQEEPEAISSARKGKGKGKEIVLNKITFTLGADDFNKISHLVEARVEPNRDMAGIDPAKFGYHHRYENKAATLFVQEYKKFTGKNPFDISDKSDLLPRTPPAAFDTSDQLPRTPPAAFDTSDQLSRTPPAAFASRNLLPTTPQAKGNLTTTSTFFDNSVTSTEVSELNQSNKTVAPSEGDSKDGQKSVTVLLSEKAKTKILTSAPPGSEIVINQGEDGSLNDVNSIYSEYRYGAEAKKTMKTDSKGQFVSSNSQHDHVRGTIDHDNSNFANSAASSSNSNYVMGTAHSVGPREHQMITQGRIDLETHLNLRANVNSPIAISNNGTIYQKSEMDELVAVRVVEALPQSTFDKLGTTLERSIRSTQKAYYLDRLHIASNMEALGIKDAAAYMNFTQVNNANKTSSHANWTLLNVVRQGTPEMVQSAPFITVVNDLLINNLGTKKFQESIRSLYPPNSNIDILIEHSRKDTNLHLNLLCNALKEKGVDIGNLRKFNPDLKGLGAYNLDTLTWVKWDKSELCQSKNAMDLLALDIKARAVTRGRARILPPSAELQRLITGSKGESSAIAALEEGVFQTQLAITGSPTEPSSSAPLEEGNITSSAEESASIEESTNKSMVSSASKRASQVQSSSTTSRKPNSKPVPIKKTSQGAGNSKALTIRTSPKP